MSEPRAVAGDLIEPGPEGTDPLPQLQRSTMSRMLKPPSRLQNARGRLRQVNDLGRKGTFVGTCLKGEDEVGAVELSVTVPIPGLPARIAHHPILVLTCLEHLDEIARVEPSVQVGITVSRSEDHFNQILSVSAIYATVRVQIESRILSGKTFAEQLDVGCRRGPVPVKIAQQELHASG